MIQDWYYSGGPFLIRHLSGTNWIRYRACTIYSEPGIIGLVQTVIDKEQG